MTSEPRRGWWIVPTVSTVLTLPIAAFTALCLFFVGFAYDSCDPGGCVRTDQHVVLTLFALPVTAPLIGGLWVAMRFRRLYWGTALCFLTPLAPVLALGSLLTIPAGH